MAVPKKYEHIDFKPPKAVADKAEKGLKYRRQSGKGGLSSQEAGKSGIGSGVQRAVNLKNRNNLTPETIKMMRGFFSRHEKNKSIAPKNKQTPWEDAGHVAWLLWGGDPGKKWVDKILKQMEEADMKEKQEKSKKADAYDNLIDQWIQEYKEWAHPNVQAKFNTYGWEVTDFRPSLGKINLVREWGGEYHVIRGQAKKNKWSFSFDGKKLRGSYFDLEQGLKKVISEVDRESLPSRVAFRYLQSDLSPSLGRSDSPCDLLKRIDQEVKNPKQKDKLLHLVENGHDLKNSEAHIIYDPITESGYGKSKFKQIDITPHAQYRMDLRGVDVRELKSALFEFQKVVQRDLSQKGWSKYEDQMEKYLVTFIDSSGLKVVFEPLFHKDVPDLRNLYGATIITAYYKNQFAPNVNRSQCGI